MWLVICKDLKTIINNDKYLMFEKYEDVIRYINELRKYYDIKSNGTYDYINVDENIFYSVKLCTKMF